MRFGPVTLAEATGAVLAHSVKLTRGRLRKGAVLDAEALTALAEAGLTEVVAARLDPGDLDENTAAARLAAALVPDPGAANLRLSKPFTGRVNLIASGPGVVQIDAAAIAAVNRIHPMITVATMRETRVSSAARAAAAAALAAHETTAPPSRNVGTPSAFRLKPGATLVMSSRALCSIRRWSTYPTAFASRRS